MVQTTFVLRLRILRSLNDFLALRSDDNHPFLAWSRPSRVVLLSPFTLDF